MKQQSLRLSQHYQGKNYVEYEVFLGGLLHILCHLESLAYPTLFWPWVVEPKCK